MTNNMNYILNDHYLFMLSTIIMWLDVLYYYTVFSLWPYQNRPAPHFWIATYQFRMYDTHVICLE